MPRLIALLVILATVAGCSDDPTGPEATPFAITGAVTDADGNPVADAAIVLDLALEPVDKAAAMPPQTTIRVSLLEGGPVQITVLDACRADTFDHRELDLASGVHSIPVIGVDADGRQLTEQALWIELVTPEGESELQIMLQRNLAGSPGDYGSWDHTYVRDHVRVQATTDAEGWFTMNPCVGFGAAFTLTDETGEPLGVERVAWRVRAWAYHADHASGASSTWRDLDPDTGGTVSVIMGD